MLDFRLALRTALTVPVRDRLQFQKALNRPVRFPKPILTHPTTSPESVRYLETGTVREPSELYRKG